MSKPAPTTVDQFIRQTIKTQQYEGRRPNLQALAVAAASGGRKRNKIMNGNFRFNQRGYVSGTISAAAVYAHDRWRFTAGSGAYTYVAAPQGQSITIGNTGTGNVLEQVIERANLPAGTYVLSWEGTSRARAYNVGGSAPASFVEGPLILQIDGLADYRVQFGGQAAGATLGKVQLEPGTYPTPFEELNYGDELSMCQRYYQRFVADNSASTIAVGIASSTTAIRALIPTRVDMRTTPTLDASAASGFDLRLDNAGANPSIVPSALALNAGSSGRHAVSIDITASGLTTGRTYGVRLSSAAYLGLNAEI